jgi:hypothetical protein
MVVDSAPEFEFDRIVEAAAMVCGTKFSLLSLIENDRQLVKAKHGIDVSEAPRSVSICSETILHNELFEVQDLSESELFKSFPSVTGDLSLRFYAGAQLRSYKGYNIGSLCVIDVKPHSLTEIQKTLLTALACLASDLLEKRAYKLKQIDASDTLSAAQTLQQACKLHQSILARFAKKQLYWQHQVEQITDIISWTYSAGNITTFALGGTNRNGVYGAMLATLADALLDGIAPTGTPAPSPERILSQLHHTWRKRRDAGKVGPTDTISCGIISLDPSSRILAFAGSDTPLLIQNGTGFTLYPADNNPVGSAFAGFLYNRQIVNLEENQLVVLPTQHLLQHMEPEAIFLHATYAMSEADGGHAYLSSVLPQHHDSACLIFSL